MAGWPEGNFFPPFTPPREAAAQINYCLESPVHKVEKKKKGTSKLRQRNGYCILWCKQHVCEGVHELGPNLRFTQLQCLFCFLWVQTHTIFPDRTLYFNGSHLSDRRHCSTAWKAGDRNKQPLYL